MQFFKISNLVGEVSLLYISFSIYTLIFEEAVGINQIVTR